LRGWARSKASLAAKYGLDSGYLLKEEFALFLWLRVMGDKDDDLPPYRIRLIGTSAYVHRDAWSGRKEFDIEPDTGFVAVDAAFFGTLRRTNLGDTRIDRTWRSVIAVPIVYARSEDQLDRLTVGVITVNSTRRIVDKRVIDELAREERTVLNESPSILSFISEDEFEDLAELLLSSALDVIAPTPSPS
jgi:hypothetical protein